MIERSEETKPASISMLERPTTIFKYEPFSLRAVQNLKASSVYFGSPASFNDPYDCGLIASIAEVSRDELGRLHSECQTSEAYPEEIRRTIPSLSLEEFERQVRRGAQVVLDRVREQFLQTKGVTCFSERNDHLLMWSHYGGRYRGFCLEFRTIFDPFTKLKKVRYADRIPQFQLSDFIRNENHEKLTEMFCTKSLSWEYEQEWRVLHEKAGTLFCYERAALKAIYFGPDIDEQDRDLLAMIMYCQFPDAELWIGRRSLTDFKVEFDRAPGYVPHAEARRRGLG